MKRKLTSTTTGWLRWVVINLPEFSFVSHTSGLHGIQLPEYVINKARIGKKRSPLGFWQQSESNRPWSRMGNGLTEQHNTSVFDGFFSVKLRNFTLQSFAFGLRILQVLSSLAQIKPHFDPFCTEWNQTPLPLTLSRDNYPCGNTEE